MTLHGLFTWLKPSVSCQTLGCGMTLYPTFIFPLSLSLSLYPAYLSHSSSLSHSSFLSIGYTFLITCSLSPLMSFSFSLSHTFYRIHYSSLIFLFSHLLPVYGSHPSVSFSYSLYLQSVNLFNHFLSLSLIRRFSLVENTLFWNQVPGWITKILPYAFPCKYSCGRLKTQTLMSSPPTSWLTLGLRCRICFFLYYFCSF